MRTAKPAVEPVSYLPETVLTKRQLARALDCSLDTIEASDLPVSYALGPQMPRYIWGDVVAALRGAAA